jgi:hypothetical protein
MGIPDLNNIVMRYNPIKMLLFTILLQSCSNIETKLEGAGSSCICGNDDVKQQANQELESKIRKNLERENSNRESELREKISKEQAEKTKKENAKIEEFKKNLEVLEKNLKEKERDLKEKERDLDNQSICSNFSGRSRIRKGSIILEIIEDTPVLYIPGELDKKVKEKYGFLTVPPRGILFGETGSGKTTLFNLLTGSKEECGDSIGSITRSIVDRDVLCVNGNFNLVDAPGTDSKEDAFRHALILKDSLNGVKYNRIIVVLRYDNKLERVVDHFQKVCRPIKKYIDRTCLLISHWDHKNKKCDPTEHAKILEGLLRDKGYKNELLFYSKTSLRDVLATHLLSILNKTQATVCDISWEDLHVQGWNILDLKGKMEEEYNSFDIGIQKRYNAYKGLIEKHKKNRDILYLLLTEFKLDLEAILSEVEKKRGEVMMKLEDYHLHISLKNLCMQYTDRFRDEISKYVKNPFEGNFRKCPNCEKVWSKMPDEGCDSVFCGKREEGKIKAETNFNVTKDELRTYELIRENDLPVNIAEKPINKRNPLTSYILKNSDLKIGCRHKFTWTDAYSLNNEELREYLGAMQDDDIRTLVNTQDYKNKAGLHEEIIYPSLC